MGILMGHPFNLHELGLLAVYAVGASFATVGISGLPALTPLALVLRPFGLSYEVAVPLMLIIDPLGDMVRTMLNVAINCVIPILAGGREVMPTTEAR
jgi:Na+/H+-dicarboxylate symporter